MAVSALTGALCLGASVDLTRLTLQGTVDLQLAPSNQPDASWQAASPHITGGSFEYFTLSLQNVDSPALVPYAWLTGVGFAVLVAFFGFLFHLCQRLRRGRPFAAVTTAGLAGFSVIFLAFSLAAPALFADLNQRILADAGVPMEGMPFGTAYYFGVGDWLAVAGGVFLAVLACVFHIGHRLQREGEGLV